MPKQAGSFGRCAWALMCVCVCECFLARKGMKEAQSNHLLAPRPWDMWLQLRCPKRGVSADADLRIHCCANRARRDQRLGRLSSAHKQAQPPHTDLSPQPGLGRQGAPGPRREKDKMPQNRAPLTPRSTAAARFGWQQGPQRCFF